MRVRTGITEGMRVPEEPEPHVPTHPAQKSPCARCVHDNDQANMYCTACGAEFQGFDTGYATRKYYGHTGWVDRIVAQNVQCKAGHPAAKHRLMYDPPTAATIGDRRHCAQCGGLIVDK